MSLATPELIAQQYDSLRSDSVFKNRDDGEELFTQFRLKQITSYDLERITGKTQAAFAKVNRRLDNPNPRKVKSKSHVKKVNKTHKKIKKAQGVKDSKKKKNNGKDLIDPFAMNSESEEDEDDSITDAVHMFRILMLKTNGVAIKMMKMHYTH